jgi:medium-chain acyl-[acyl-carrier-protein] hydrolase
MVEPSRTEHRQQFTVRAYETDPQGRLQPPILCRLLQEVAVAHANRLEVGVGLLIDHGVAWVLTQLQLEMERWPGPDEEIAITTWPHAANRLFTERRFELSDGSDRPLGSATTLWIMIDLAQRRPVRFPLYVAERLNRLDLGDSPLRLGDLATPDTIEKQLAFTVRRTDLDLAGHVNNTSYVEWAVEAVSDGVWSACDLQRLEIQFLSECHHGQTVLSGCQTIDHDERDGYEVRHVILREDDGAETARARTVWRTR